MPATRLGWGMPTVPPAAPPAPPPRFNRLVVVTSVEEAAQVAAEWSREYRAAHPEESQTEPSPAHEG